MVQATVPSIAFVEKIRRFVVSQELSNEKDRELRIWNKFTKKSLQIPKY
jgi:hypothetical protein